VEIVDEYSAKSFTQLPGLDQSWTVTSRRRRVFDEDCRRADSESFTDVSPDAYLPKCARISYQRHLRRE